MRRSHDAIRYHYFVSRFNVQVRRMFVSRELLMVTIKGQKVLFSLILKSIDFESVLTLSVDIMGGDFGPYYLPAALNSLLEKSKFITLILCGPM